VPPPAAQEALPEPQAFEASLAVEEAAVSDSGAALTYALSGRPTVPGNGEPRKVTVATLRLRPDVTYVTAPKLEPVCYRQAEIRNDTAFTLLPGMAQLFEGGEYLGATRLDMTVPGQVFALALGADERLRVERRLAAREVDKAFIIGDRRRIRYAYTIEVENLRDGPQVVLVRDQLPVSRDEQIKVKLEGAEPRPNQHSELNLLEWKLVLDRGSRQLVRFDYSVEHPRGMDVIGLA
jgi:uncharacterized protein (TIGR02231 family)